MKKCFIENERKSTEKAATAIDEDTNDGNGCLSASRDQIFSTHRYKFDSSGA